MWLEKSQKSIARFIQILVAPVVNANLTENQHIGVFVYDLSGL